MSLKIWIWKLLQKLIAINKGGSLNALAIICKMINKLFSISSTSGFHLNIPRIKVQKENWWDSIYYLEFSPPSELKLWIQLSSLVEIRELGELGAPEELWEPGILWELGELGDLGDLGESEELWDQVY